MYKICFKFQVRVVFASMTFSLQLFVFKGKLQFLQLFHRLCIFSCGFKCVAALSAIEVLIMRETYKYMRIENKMRIHSNLIDE